MKNEGYVQYSANNSGGDWWLTDEDWKALEAAGWIVHWASLVESRTKTGRTRANPDGSPKFIPIGEAPENTYIYATKDEDGEYRYLGALAQYAYKPNCINIREAAEEWERITGKSSTEAGCPCCGQPHRFTAYSKKQYYLESGPELNYECTWD